MIRIVTDTTAGLPQDIIDEYNLELVSQYIVFGEESYREFFDMDAAEFYARQAAAQELPHTSAPTVGDFRVLYERMLSETPDATILCIHPSTDVSGTVRSAYPAAEMFPDADIRIIDTRSVALGLGLMVCEAARMVRDGAGIGDVLARLDDMREGMNILFIVDTLEYLHKGGRIGRAAHLIGSMLDIKPVLAMRDGVVESYARYRTRRRSLAGLRDLVLESARGKSGLYLAVIHAVCEEEARQLADELCEELKPDVFMFGENGPSIGVHAGPGTIGVCWYEPPG